MVHGRTVRSDPSLTTLGIATPIFEGQDVILMQLVKYFEFNSANFFLFKLRLRFWNLETDGSGGHGDNGTNLKCRNMKGLKQQR